jgi:tetratricopeptide (TPR) repeat protein/tRNA A-37 threonylcarbamoyl transferase component Bud32
MHAQMQAGTVLSDRYRIVELLGEGGMGAVYKAEDLKLGRIVALKAIRREYANNATTMERFKQELVLAREVTHHNVVRLYDIGNADGIDFITMEFVDGEDLGTILQRQGKLGTREAAEIVEQVGHGLQAAHERGIIHRDLKPGNIMREQSGRIVLMDFGLAKPESHDSLTETGTLVGTLEYMSPEQAKGERIDARSDLFAVGLILYELLTGTRPYKADTTIGSLLKRTREAAEPLSRQDATIPAPLTRICSKCLERDPAHRYESATALLGDLEAWLHPAAKKRSFVWPAAALILAAVAFAAACVIVYLRVPAKRVAAHPPVSVLVADFVNNTGEPVFDDTLEPMFNVALEGASFLNAFDRRDARRIAGELPNPRRTLDKEAAQLVAVSQGLGVLITGTISRYGSAYEIAVQALDARTGKQIADSRMTAANKDAVLRGIPKLAAPLRKSLGDTMPESAQIEAVSGAFKAASLETVHQHSIAMEQQFAGKFEEAFKSFAKAAELDPNFARAYSGMSASAANTGKVEDAEKYIKLAMEHSDRMTARERYRNRALFYSIVGNYQQCVDESRQLLAEYPLDINGQQNLSNCLAGLRELPQAVEAARKAVEIMPKGVFQRLNFSFLSTMTGDFATGEREARAALELNPTSEGGFLMLAEAQFGLGRIADAKATYEDFAKISALGASMASTGMADLSLYEGRLNDAVRILEQGVTVDEATHSSDAAANKLAKLAYIEAWRGQNKAAIAAARKALASSQSTNIRFLAARILVDAGEPAQAEKIANQLALELQAEPQAYAKIIEGKIKLARGDAPGAIKTLTDGNKLLDTWIGHDELGRAYLQAQAFVEADSEFDRCIKRHGEAMELFMDDVPTYGYFPPVYYYQGRVRQGLKSTDFVSSYRMYVQIRGSAGEDPLLAEIRAAH